MNSPNWIASREDKIVKSNVKYSFFRFAAVGRGRSRWVDLS